MQSERIDPRRSAECPQRAHAGCHERIDAFVRRPERREPLDDETVAIPHRYETLRGGVADESLEAYGAPQSGFEVGAGEDRVAEGVEGDWVDEARHLQAEAGVTGRLDGQRPKARHGRLRRAFFAVAQDAWADAGPQRQLSAVDSARVQCANDGLDPGPHG